MAWSQSDLDALDVSIKKGVRSVTYKDGAVVYHSLDEMLKLRGVMQAEIAGTTGQTRTVGAYASGLSGSVYAPFDTTRRC
jgi:hypothetical protein